MPAVVVVHQLCDEQIWLNSAGAMVPLLLKAAERRGQKVPPPPLQSQTVTEAVPDTLVKATCRGEGYPIALVWSCLLWEDLEPRFGDTEVPLPGSFCFRLEGGVRGGPVAFILSFS